MLERRAVDGIHDLGGMQGFGAVRTADGELSHHEAWETRAQVLGLVTGAASRSWIEGLDPATYLSSSYYVRWLRAAEASLLQRGRLEQADLDRWTATFEADPAARPPTRRDPAAVEIIQAGLPPHQHGPITTAAWSVGDRVRVRRMRPEAHHRCPRYLRGAVGEVERVIGADPVPDAADEDDVEPVYTVRFGSVDLFGDQTETGERPYALLIDLWERYLETP